MQANDSDGQGPEDEVDNAEMYPRCEMNADHPVVSKDISFPTKGG